MIIFVGIVKKGNMYYIWFDESDKDGEFYSNFYGGVLIKSEDLENVLQMANSLILELGIEEEIKWQRVNAFMYEKYEKVVDFIFDLLKYDKKRKQNDSERKAIQIYQ